LVMRDLGLLILRLALGGLLAGHGAQKLFGAFGGHGLKGTAGFFESGLGLKPGQFWATMAGTGELNGGLLTVLGLMFPIGPIIAIGPMVVAWGKAHWGKPIWASEGGAELPLMNVSVALALICTGAGRFSVDRMLGIRLPAWMTALTALGVAAGSYLALARPDLIEQLPSQLSSHDQRPEQGPEQQQEAQPFAAS
jgi:putative oxidoreductase